MDAVEIETNVVDLRGASLDEVKRHLDELRVPLADLLAQVERTRHNLGNPGRADGNPGRAD